MTDNMDLRDKVNTWASALTFVGCECDAPVEVWVRDARHILNRVESYDLWREYKYKCRKCGAALTRKGETPQ